MTGSDDRAPTTASDASKTQVWRATRPSENHGLLLQAEGLRRRGEVTEAEKLYRRMLGPSRGYEVTIEDTIEINLGLGEVLAQKHAFNDAVASFSAASNDAKRLELFDIAKEAALKEASIRVELGQFVEAARLLAEVSEGRDEHGRTPKQRSAEDGDPTPEQAPWESVFRAQSRPTTAVQDQEAAEQPSIAQMEAAKLRLVTDRRLGKLTPEWIKRVAQGLPPQPVKAAG